MMITPNWQAEAKKAAAFVSQPELFQARRGAIRWRMVGVLVAFGNDGYEQDERVRNEVETLRAYLAEARIRELGFATCKDGYSWAMLVEGTGVGGLDMAVHASWPNPCAVQHRIARSMVVKDDELSDNRNPSLN
jgi:hypothetical protein